MSADSASGDDEPAQSEDELQKIVKDLWQHLEQLRMERGSPALSVIAKKAGLPKSTVSEWYQKQTVVPDWDEFTRLVKALEDQPDLWSQRWRDARAAADDLRSLRAKRSRSEKPPASQKPASSAGLSEPAQALPAEPGKASPPYNVTRRGDRRLWLTVGAAVVVVAAVILIAPQVFYAQVNATVPSLLGLAPDVACATLREVELDCAPNDNEATTEINIVHDQSHLPGAAVPQGTAVEYTYESTAPVLLRRYQAPVPDSANFISPTEPGPAGWSAESSLGWVYEKGNNNAPGLVPVYRHRCTSPICSEKLVYFLSRDGSPRKNYVFEDEAFRCFNPDAPPPGTRPLQSLMNNEHARIWAVPGTPEYQSATSNGFKDPDPSGRPLCYIW